LAEARDTRGTYRLTASHTHTGRQHRKDATERIIAALAEAHEAAVPVKLETDTVPVQETISFNRRFLMTDGSVRFNPGVLNPDILRPVGPIDPQVGILFVRAADDNRPLASLVNFALHLDTVGDYSQYSADYPYYLSHELRRELGDAFVSLFGLGCCGDVNHVDVTRPNLKWKHTQGQTMLTKFEPKATDMEPSPVTTEYIGKVLAATVQAATSRLNAVQPALAVRREIVQAPLATYSEMDLAWAREAVAQPRSFLLGVRARRILALERLRAEHGETICCEVQVFRIAEDTRPDADFLR
jgi:neutral ceramidase